MLILMMTITATRQGDAEELLQRILYSDLATLVDDDDPPLVLPLPNNSSLSNNNQTSASSSLSFGHDNNDDDGHVVTEMIWQYLTYSTDDGDYNNEQRITRTTTTTLRLDDDDDDNKWKKGWKQIGSILLMNLLSPFCIYDTATQALFLKESGDLDNENNNNMQSKKGATSSSSSCRLFTTTCLLVCCAALQCCPSPPPSSSDNNNTDATTSPPLPRPLSRKRRWRSCMMNTIRLIQQQWFLVQQQQHYSNNDANDNKKNKNAATIIISIFIHYVVPTCLYVQQTLFHDDNCNDNDFHTVGLMGDETKNPAWFWQAAIHAGLIATISSMAATVATMNRLTIDDDKDKNNKLLELLIQTLNRIILMTDSNGGDGGDCCGDGRSGDLHDIWKHPWRTRHRLGRHELLRAADAVSSSSTRTTTFMNKNRHHHNSSLYLQDSIPAHLSYENSLCYWTAPVLLAYEEDDDDDEADDWNDDNDDMDENDNDRPQSRAHRRSESVACMNTIWNNIGIAVLVRYNLFVDEHRPLVYTNAYSWQIGFPHVASLLFTTDDNVDDGQQDKQQMLGYTLLEWLLSSKPEYTLSKPVSTKTTTVGPEQQPPLSPIPVFQLLSNRIIDTASAVATTTATTKTSATTVVLPSGYQAYQYMKLLLSKYKLEHQLDLVRQLYTDCPHLGLGPKLLDLLRGLVLTLAQKVDGTDDLFVGTSSTRLALWDYLDTLLRDLDGHVHCLNNEIMGIKTATNQNGNSSSSVCQKSLFLIDSVQDFVADAEKFVAVLTLIRTWMLVNKNKHIPDIPQLDTRLEAAHKALEIMFEYATENDGSVKDVTTITTGTSARPPEQQLFRLQLLMQALEESIQLLKNNTSSS